MYVIVEFCLITFFSTNFTDSVSLFWDTFLFVSVDISNNIIIGQLGHDALKCFLKSFAQLDFEIYTGKSQ